MFGMSKMKLFAALCLCMLLALPLCAFADEGDVALNAAYFPDAVFLNYVRGFDADRNEVLTLEEREAVRNIRVYSKGITSLKGIEYFPNLDSLLCASNQLTELDVSQNTALTTLLCGSNQLTELDVSQNTALTSLECDRNQLSKLDVSNNTALTHLGCNYNQLTSLDVSANTALTNFQCDYNQLTELDVSQNTALTSFGCGYNQLTSLDVSKNILLTSLGCEENQLTSLNVAQNTALTRLDCDGNQLTTLDVTPHVGLETLGCSDNQLTQLDLSKNPALSYLNCSRNQLVSLDVTHNTELSYFSCTNNQLSSLNVLQHKDLTIFDCSNNQLKSLDVSRCEDLSEFYCSDNQLTELDLSQNATLDFMHCNGNQLTKLDVSHNPELSDLICSNNQLTELNVSQRTELTRFCCDGNQLTSLDVSHNTLLDHFRCNDNHLAWLDLSQNQDLTNPEYPEYLVVGPQTITMTAPVENGMWKLDLSPLMPKEWLAKVEVPEGNYDPATGLWSIVDKEARQNTCSYAIDTGLPAAGKLLVKIQLIRQETPAVEGIPLDAEHFPDDVFRSYLKQFDTADDDLLTPAECKAVGKIFVSEMGIESLQGVEYFPLLSELNCSGNQLKTLDVSNNTMLTQLDCGKNQLTSLDVSQNIKLERLWCWMNQLTQLDVSRCTALSDLMCDDNQLTSLDVTRNTELSRLSCGQNQLTELNVSQNPDLSWLYCDSNQLTGLDVSSNPGIYDFRCHYNHLTWLDLSGNQRKDLESEYIDISPQTITMTAPLENSMWAANLSSLIPEAWLSKVQVTEGSYDPVSGLWSVAHSASDTYTYTISSGLAEAGDLTVQVHLQKEIANVPSSSDDLTNPELIPSDDLMNAVLTPEEIELVNSGETWVIWLEMDEMTEEEVPFDDKYLIKSVAGEGTITHYLDLNLFKQIGQGNNSIQQITETSGEIAISILIPPGHRGNPLLYSRSFGVIRVHNGKPEKLRSAYNPETGMITFWTDGFSTYALYYVDTPVADTLPKTGDSTPLAALWLLLAASGTGMLLLNRRKAHISNR